MFGGYDGNLNAKSQTFLLVQQDAPESWSDKYKYTIEALNKNVLTRPSGFGHDQAIVVDQKVLAFADCPDFNNPEVFNVSRRDLVIFDGSKWTFH